MNAVTSRLSKKKFSIQNHSFNYFFLSLIESTQFNGLLLEHKFIYVNIQIIWFGGLARLFFTTEWKKVKISRQQ